MASWKMSIRAKLTLAFFFLILMAVITTGFSINGILRTKRGGGTEIQFAEQIHSSLVEREVEHVRWALNLQEHLIVESAENFSIELDPTECNLGKWLAGEGGLQELLASFPPHLEQGVCRIGCTPPSSAAPLRPGY